MTRARNISNPQAVTLPLTVSANITSNATLAVGNTAITGTLTASANVNLDSGTLFVDGTNNRVGINNAAPIQALTVTGNIFANGTVTFANSTSNTVNFFANNRISIGANAAWGDLTLYGTSDKFISVTSITGSTTKVGIDFNPSMSVSDATSSQSQARIYSVDSNYGASIVLANKSQGALGNSLVDRVIVAANGNVGVGTSNIFSPVVIKSDWRSGYGQVSLQANTSGATVGHSYHNSSGTRLGYASLDSTSNSMSVGVSGTGGSLYLVTNDANRVTISNTGYVGIGVAPSTAEVLNVGGGTKASYKITTGLKNGYSFGTGGWTTIFSISASSDKAIWAKIRAYNTENGAASHFTFYFSAVIRHNGSPYNDFYSFSSTADANLQSAAGSSYAQFRFTDLGTTNGTLYFQAYNTSFSNNLYPYEIDAYGYDNINWA